MSRVDDELARALADSEAQARAEEPVPVTSPVAKVPANAKRNLGLLIALLAMGGGIVALVMTSFDQAAVYSRGVEQLLQEKEKLTGRNVRVEGTLVKGTIKRRDQPCEYRFDLERKGARVAVRYAQCIVPDTFRDMPGTDVAVTAQGSLVSAGYFEATQIMAKCPSKHEMKDLASKGEQAPHAMGVSPAIRVE
jgi:cytochrome c-type biogenesis protein CcmE